MPTPFSFDPVDLPPGIPALRAEIREWLAREMPRDYPSHRRANCWAVYDADFSKRLGARGWIGMVWPRAYGGHERSAIERYVLMEELLAAGAPVGAHWIGDRQTAPAILRYGSEAQKQRYVPAIARGECFCCIGMSEPNAGSDLASVRTRAERLPDGRWKINGQKIWTTLAHRSHLIIVLARTAPQDEKHRHAGLSQFLLEFGTPGMRVQPIVDLAGEKHFNEIFFEDCVVDAECLLGTEGAGWQQVTAELSLERSGPERYLSSLALFFELLRMAGPEPASDAVRQAIGRLSSEIWTLRQMSLSVAGQLARGEDPYVQAAIVKDLGNCFEQMLPPLVQSLAEAGVRLEDDSDFARTLALLLQIAPSFSLRGGTREILRGIIARGLGLR
ncbi:MAG: acyl-CoA dehydrogenase family protein [Panacagrimonas sp.]